MRFVYPEIGQVFDTAGPYINTLIIENQDLFRRLLTDLQDQLDGLEGKAVLSLEHKPLQINKFLECINSFVPFELNKRLLLSKASSQLEKILTDTEFYERTMYSLSQMEGLLLDAAFEMTGDIIFKSLGAGALIKAAGLEFADDYSCLCEKIVDYMELVIEYDRRKLFIYVNLRSYVSDREAEEFMDTVLRHGYEVLMIENREYPVISYEKRFIVDQGLCEIR